MKVKLRSSQLPHGAKPRPQVYLYLSPRWTAGMQVEPLASPLQQSEQHSCQRAAGTRYLASAAQQRPSRTTHNPYLKHLVSKRSSTHTKQTGWQSVTSQQLLKILKSQATATKAAQLRFSVGFTGSALLTHTSLTGLSDVLLPATHEKYPEIVLHLVFKLLA